MRPLEDWQAAAAEYLRRVTAELAAVTERRELGLKHPVDDFLWHYYNLRPSHLKQWFPGIGALIEDDGSDWGPFHRRGGGIVQFDTDAFLAKRGDTVATAAAILRGSAKNPARFGCFGMHEWAMVYGLQPAETRHPYLPLRFSPERIREIVEEVGCRCSHYDAYRFFTPAARPLNLLAPTRARQAELDQPGCLHTNMDLYKWAGKLWPAVGSELLFETFLLAREIREVDMRASAYDVSAWGLPPIKVETLPGRQEYVELQRAFTLRSEPLRNDLIAVADELGV